MSSPATRTAPIKTLSIGGATFDLFVRTDESVVHAQDGLDHLSLPLGQKIRINDVISTAGGGAANTSVGLSRLGCEAAFCGIVGEDQWGSAILETFKKEGVRTDAATVVDKETSSFSLILSAASGERVILNHPGTARHLHDVTFDRDAIRNVDAVFLNHIHRESCIIQDDIIEAFTSNPQIHLSWNPGGCQIELGLEEEHNKALVAVTDILFLNKEEALAFTHADTVADAMDLLIAAGAGIVCVTDGKNGSIATDGKQVYTCPIVEGPVVDMTGAGDAFGTGVTWAIVNGKNLPTSLRAGTINARSVVGVIGAQKGLLTATQMLSELN
ncbi:carbohydrate kinase family protein [Candidatus Peribacteria bacterium]|nr:MAG: carbohydrate kinase family protein [Candidatus Peribacteria bacterium]